MAAPDYFIRQGDKDFVMQDTLKDAAGNAVLIQGASVKLQVYPVRGGAALVDDTATNLDDGTAPNKGKVSYTWPLADTGTAGTYIGQWQVTFGGGAILSFPNGAYILILISADPPTSASTLYVQLEEFKGTIELKGEAFADEDVAAALAAGCRHVDYLTGRRFYPDADVNQVRLYSPFSAGWLWIDDLITLTSLKTDEGGDGTYELTWAATDYALEPSNAIADGRPFTKLCARPTGQYLFPTLYPETVRVEGKFGWASVPAEVRQATTLIAHRLLKRARETPFAVAGFGLDGATVRVPGQDPDVVALLAPYRRDLMLA